MNGNSTYVSGMTFDPERDQPEDPVQQRPSLETALSGLEHKLTIADLASAAAARERLARVHERDRSRRKT